MLNSTFLRGLLQSPSHFLDHFWCGRNDLSGDPFLTWKAVDTQCQAQLFDCLLKKDSSRMLKQERVFITNFANGSDSCAICFILLHDHMRSLFVLVNIFAIY